MEHNAASSWSAFTSSLQSASAVQAEILIFDEARRKTTPALLTLSNSGDAALDYAVGCRTVLAAGQIRFSCDGAWGMSVDEGGNNSDAFIVATEEALAVSVLMGGFASAPITLSTVSEHDHAPGLGTVFGKWDTPDDRVVWFGIQDGVPVSLRYNHGVESRAYHIVSVNWNPTIPPDFFAETGSATQTQRDTLLRLSGSHH